MGAIEEEEEEAPGKKPFRLESDPPEKDTEFSDVVKDMPTHVISR